jgi:hypothetical protein
MVEIHMNDEQWVDRDGLGEVEITKARKDW